MSSKMPKISVPGSLEMAIIKIRASLELDWDSACEHLAGLADPNGEKFKKAVGREANRRYKSRHLVELNKSKKSFTDTGYKKGIREGRLLGQREVEEATKRWQISYPCNVCGKPLYLEPNGPATKAAVEYLKGAGWGHGSCHK